MGIRSNVGKFDEEEEFEDEEEEEEEEDDDDDDDVDEGDDDDDYEEEENDEKEAAWGKSKKIYYNADNVDFELQSSDEEAPAEEEAEVLRLQRKAAAGLHLEDFEQYSISKDEDDGTEQDSDHDSDAMEVEKVKKNVGALSKEEQMEVLMSDAPELLGLLTELKEGLGQIRTKIQPLLQKLKDEDYGSNEGIVSYVEVKNLLLLTYCQSITFYLLLKAEGHSVRDHPVIARLVEIRMYLEKVRPIDKKLESQIERLLKGAITPAADDDREEDASKHSPTLGMPASNLDQDTREGKAMTAPDFMNGTLKQLKKQSKACAEKDAQQQLPGVKELANELEGRREEMQEFLCVESKEMLREKSRLDGNAQQAEDLVASVSLSKVDRVTVKHQTRSRNGLMLADLDDDVAGLIGTKIGTPKISGADDVKLRKLSQVIAESGKPMKRPKVQSGDADLPFREDLGERRRKHELQKSSKGQSFDTDNKNDDSLEAEPVEDEFYQIAKKFKAAKQAEKDAKYMRTPVIPSGEEDADGKRHITNQMEKNRGLTPHRKKLTKNPRKKYKLKHEKAVIRRKGQVREMKVQRSSYGGETTGIRTNISRSVRLKS